MTKKMKIILILTFIAVFAVGFVVGAFSPFAKLMAKVMKMTSQGSMISHYATLTDVARSHGDRDAYKKSLMSFLAVLNDVNKHPSEFFDTKTTSTDIAFTYERLSRIERELGNDKKADDYMNKAVQACGQSGLKDCSVEKLSSISKKLEENSIFSSKEKDTKAKH